MIIIHSSLFWRCTGNALADYRSANNWRLTIGRLSINTKKLILLSYLSYLFRLRLLSEDSYLLEGLQSADKTKMYPKTKLPKCTHFCQKRKPLSCLFTFGNKK